MAPKPVPKPKSLSARERQFALRFAQTGNASRAAREAGYSEATAKQIGYELRTSPKFKHVQDFIDSLQQDHLALIKRELPASVRTLVRQRDFDPGVLKDKAGKWKSWEDLDPEDRDCLTECHVKDFIGGSSTRVKWANKQLAASKIIEWTLKHADNRPKESESEIKAQLRQRLDTLAAELFPEEDGPPIVQPDAPETPEDQGVPG